MMLFRGRKNNLVKPKRAIYNVQHTTITSEENQKNVVENQKEDQSEEIKMMIISWLINLKAATKRTQYPKV